MNRWVWVMVVGVALVRCGQVDGAAEEPTSQPGGAVEIEARTGDEAEHEESAASFEGWVLSGEGYPEGVADEAGYLAYVEGRIEAFLSAGQGEALPLQKVSYQLAAANWMLSRQIEPMVSRLMLGIEKPGDKAALLSGVEQAKFRLAACQAALQAIPARDEGEEDQDRAKAGEDQLSVADLERLVESLTAFAGAIGVIWGADQAEGNRKTVRRAALALGVLLEDDREEVAQLASLYQALAYGRMGRLERALSALELALAPLPADGRPAGLYNRLFRCQILARQGGYAVAWSLLLRLEERVTEWFGSPEEARQASRSVGLVRLAIARQWEEGLRGEGARSEADWCKQAADALEAALKEGGGQLEVLGLDLAVPQMVEPVLAEGVEVGLPLEEAELADQVGE